MAVKFLILFISAFSLRVVSQEEGFLKHDGGTIHYRSFGSGKPLLIINGGPGMSSEGFIALATKLSENCHTIIYDQRGTGKSRLDKPDSSTITMEKMAGDIEALRKKFGFNNWAVLGHSFGGMMASYYAANFPDRVNALILSSSGGIDMELMSYIGNMTARLTEPGRDSLNAWNDRIAAGDTSYHARLCRGMALAPVYLYNKKYVPLIAERLTQGKPEIMALVWKNLYAIRFDCSEKLMAFNKRVLIIQGKQDIIEEKTAEKAHRVLKRSTVVLMDSCGHYGWLDRPDIYFPAITDFISSIAN